MTHREPPDMRPRLRFGSLFSGIGGFDLGLERAGMTCVLQCEIDPYRREVLARHWPEVERYDDVRDVGVHGRSRCEGGKHSGQRDNGPHAKGGGIWDKHGASTVDLICGGFPCQDLSVAGKRAGLSGSRSGLFWEFARIVGEVRPTWVLIENVPGLLSSNGGDDFALVLGALEELGYGWAYRILDSRFFGVPQRRRRVYIVGHSGGRIDYPAAVLFEPESGGGDTQASGAAGEDVARTLVAGTGGARGWRGDDGSDTYVVNPLGAKDGYRLDLDLDHETYVPEVVGAIDGTFGHHGLAHSAQSAVAGHYIASPLEASDGHHGHSSPRGDGSDNLIAETVRSHPRPGSNSVGNVTAIRLAQTSSNGHGISEDGTTHSLEGTAGDAAHAQSVRRLTPTECERLQAFPDGWTHGKDGPRYAAMGDAVTVNVIQWIGERMMMVEALVGSRP